MTTLIHDFDEWHEIVKVFFDTRLLDSGKPFRAQSSFVKHRDLILAKVRFGPQYFDHDPKLILEVDNNYLLFERYYEGNARGLADGQSAQIGPGNLHLVDMSRSFCTVTSDVVVDSVVIPHFAVGYDPSRDPAYVSIPENSSQARILMLAQAALQGAVGQASDDADNLNAAFCSLIGTLLLNRDDDVSPQQAAVRGQALIRQYIEDHLNDPELSVEQICRAFRLSRSRLYRLFEDQGGIASFITARRLDNCLADLVSAPSERGQVRKVAERWGFYEPANFNRGFRDRFGARPSDCLGIGMATRKSGFDLSNSPLRQWMSRS